MKIDSKLLRTLCEIPGTSGHEADVSEFLLNYISKHCRKWKTRPRVFHGEGFQDCIVLKFGRPRTAIFAHMDTVGFTVRYFNQLVAVGSPDTDGGALLVGHDSKGPIECELEMDKEHHALYKFGRPIEPGTPLSYKVNFRESKDYIESAYLDNRLGIYAALKVAETLKNGAIVFSCWEEHGGGSVPYLAKMLFEDWKIRQALISDITWISDGVEFGKGCVISLRDRNIPRRAYVNRIIQIAHKHHIPVQLEVEGMGSSDGGELQRSPYPIDWCFVGAPEQHAHTPDEKVHKADILSMITLYQHLMKSL